MRDHIAESIAIELAEVERALKAAADKATKNLDRAKRYGGKEDKKIIARATDVHKRAIAALPPKKKETKDDA